MVNYTKETIVKISDFRKRDFSRFAFCADVGGTKTDAAVFGLKRGKPEAVFVNRYVSGEIKNFLAVVKETIREAEELGINLSRGCIAAAGPVSADRTSLTLTNLELEIDAKKISKNTPIKDVALVNDFAAVGYGLPYLKKADVVELPRPSKKHRGKQSALIIGPGTGLGVAFKLDKKTIPSEAGHTVLNAVDDFEHELFEHLKKNVCYGSDPEYEDVVSGRGLVNIYDFLLSQNCVRQEEAIRSKIDLSENKAETISQLALENKDKLCVKALEMFVTFFARVTKALVLSFLPGEVYLAGGIAPKIINTLKSGTFVKEFERSQRMSEILKNTPIFVVTNPFAGLLGAAAIGLKLQNV